MAEESPQTDPETREQIKALKKDIATLRSDLKDLAKSARGDGKARYQDAKTRAWHRARDVEDRASRQIQSAYGTMSEETQRAVERTRQEVQDRPLTVTLVALAVGFVIGKLMKDKG
ncbi:MAG: DUF883 family protein [Planctomycetota bacterium]